MLIHMFNDICQALCSGNRSDINEDDCASDLWEEVTCSYCLEYEGKWFPRMRTLDTFKILVGIDK